MARCETCMTTPVHPDKKCCFNCARADTNCEVWHNCGEDCPGWVSNVKTNADRIRAMTDEELAAVLADHENRVAFEVCLSFGLPSVDYDFEESTNELLNWLKQPAEVDHD